MTACLTYGQLKSFAIGVFSIYPLGPSITMYAAMVLLGFMGAVLANPLDLQESASYAHPTQYQPLDQRLEADYSDKEDDGQYRANSYPNANSIPGLPGTDYPIFASIPPTTFSCLDKMPGFYADEEAFCQVWHYCKTDGLRESFLCPNGTVYSQANRVCEWWFNVNCEETAAAYRVNEDLYIIPDTTPAPQDSEIPMSYYQK